MNTVRKTVTAAASVVLSGLLGLGLAIPAGADESDTVSVSGASVEALNESGFPTAAIDGGTVLTLKGSGFQAIKNGAGGIYVVFGWVSDTDGLSWAPSNGGQTGENYRYVPDAEDETNQGHSRYIAFEGSKTAAAANGGFIAEDGTWETELAIPSATFESMDRDGNPTDVDCLKDTCGVITFGAHGVKNGNNETFTPITFVADTTVDPADVVAEQAEEPIGDESEQPSESASEPADTHTQETGPNSSDSSQSGVEVEDTSSNNVPTMVGVGVGLLVIAGFAFWATKRRK